MGERRWSWQEKQRDPGEPPATWQGRFVSTEQQKRTRVDKSGSLTSLVKMVAGCCVASQFAERQRVFWGGEGRTESKRNCFESRSWLEFGTWSHKGPSIASFILLEV